MKTKIAIDLYNDIVSLFNYTQNNFAQEYLMDMLKEQLDSEHLIIQRQHILIGVLKNIEIFEAFEYNKRDLHDTYDVLFDSELKNYHSEDIIHYYLSKEIRNRRKSDFIHLVLFLRKIESMILEKINFDVFPDHYKKELYSLKNILSILHLSKIKRSIDRGKFGLQQIKLLTNTILKLRKNGQLDQFFNIYFQLEAYISLSIGITKRNFVFPKLTQQHLRLKGVYHPFISNPIKNDFETDKVVVLITGANMSGKSTFLKTIGLCISLAHLGLAIPAQEAEIPFYQNISIKIDHNDDLENSYSHFMNEIQNLKSVLQVVNNKKTSLAIFDELFKGTNIDDALKISSTTIQGLSKFKSSLFFISTHLHDLKKLPVVEDGIVDAYYIHCELKKERPVFTYEIKKGWSDLKIGQILFNNEGLDKLLEG